MQGTNVRTALVSTNSITQGEQSQVYGNRYMKDLEFILILRIVLSGGIVKQH